MTHTPTHRCTERECPFFGQITTNGCTCHKTAEQMLVEQCDVLVRALERAEGELIYMAEKMPHTNAKNALVTVRAALEAAKK